MLVFVLFLPLILIVVLLFVIFPSKEDKEFLRGYREFLRENEGKEFFCYTNRKNSEKIVEEVIIPKIDTSVHVIKLVGKNPQTELDERYMSYALYNIKNPGFPNLMKVVNGELIDRSIHKSVYNAISSGREDQLENIVKSGIEKLREHESI